VLEEDAPEQRGARLLSRHPDLSLGVSGAAGVKWACLGTNQHDRHHPRFLFLSVGNGGS